MAFWRQDPRGFAQKRVGLGAELQAVDDDHGIQAVTRERQIVVPGAHIHPRSCGRVHDPVAHGPRYIHSGRITGRTQLCHQSGPQTR